MKEHLMKLQKEQFEKVKNKSKIIEVRLFDEKRKKLKLGEIITFTNSDNENQKVKAKIINLHKFKYFSQLYSSFSISDFGYSNNTNKEKLLEIIYSIYSKEDEKKFGVLGIEFEIFLR